MDLEKRKIAIEQNDQKKLEENLEKITDAETKRDADVDIDNIFSFLEGPKGESNPQTVVFKVDKNKYIYPNNVLLTMRCHVIKRTCLQTKYNPTTPMTCWLYLKPRVSLTRICRNIGSRNSLLLISKAMLRISTRENR